MRYPAELIARGKVEFKLYKFQAIPSEKVITLKVVKSLEVPPAVYNEGDTVQVFHEEYVRLMHEYPSYFEVIKNDNAR